jgi:hypothetical protein
MANSWIGLVLLIAVAALLVLALPRARLWLGMALWVVSPLALLILAILWELLTGTPRPNSLELAFTGFMYVTVFLAVPWLVVCALGFALGWWLRRTLRPETVALSRPSPKIANAPAATTATAARVPDPTPVPSVHLSPCGWIRVETQSTEWANTHWVDSPRVSDARTGRVLVDLRGADWDVKIEFPGDHRVLLLMRRYRQHGHMAVTIDLDRDSYAIDLAPGPLRSGPLAELDQAITQTWIAVAQAATATASAAVVAATPARFAAWRSAVVILVGALAAIAALTWWTVQHTPPPKVILTPLPGKPVLR